MTSPVQLQGSLSDTNCCEVLASLCNEGQTGVLVAKGPGGEKSVYLQKGRIVFAASKDPDDRLGELLLTRGAVTREQLEQASGKVRPGKRLGTILVELGFLPAADLPRWVLEQVKEIIYSLFSWGDGTYRFEPGPLPPGEVIELRISTAEIFLTGLRRVQKWSVVKKGAGEIQVHYRLASNFRELLKDVQLGKEEESLLKLLESGAKTMEETARQSSLTTLLVYQLFFAFRVLSIVLPGPPPAPVKALPEQEASPSAPPKKERAADVITAPAVDPVAVPLAAIEEKPLLPVAPPLEPASGAQTMVLKVPPRPAEPPAVPDKNSVQVSPPGRKREYRVVRMEGDKLNGKGVQQIEEILGIWSRKGYSLAGVVQGKGTGLFSSTPPSFFIFARD